MLQLLVFFFLAGTVVGVDVGSPVGLDCPALRVNVTGKNLKTKLANTALNAWSALVLRSVVGTCFMFHVSPNATREVYGSVCDSLVETKDALMSTLVHNSTSPATMSQKMVSVLFLTALLFYANPTLGAVGLVLTCYLLGVDGYISVMMMAVYMVVALKMNPLVVALMLPFMLLSHFMFRRWLARRRAAAKREQKEVLQQEQGLGSRPSAHHQTPVAAPLYVAAAAPTASKRKGAAREE